MNVKTSDKIATIVFYCIAIFISSILLSILGYIFFKGFSGISMSFLIKSPETFRSGGGIGPQILNSLFLLFLTMLITLPVGVGAGVYMAEFSKETFLTSTVRMFIEVLSSLPSIVVGLFGLIFFVQKLNLGFSMISGALALSVFNLPLIVRVTEQALRNVSKEQKEASLGLGVTHWHTIIKIMIPIAIPEIITGIILASGRVFGEAAAVMFTAGMSSPSLKFTASLDSNVSAFNLFRPAETLAVHIWKTNSEGISPDSAQIVASSAMVLILVVLIFNISSRLIGNRIYKKMMGNN